MTIILLTKIIVMRNAAQNEGALSYNGMRGLYFLAVIFAATIDVVGELYLRVDYMISIKFLYTATQ